MIVGSRNSDCEALLKAERILRDLPKVHRDGTGVLRIGKAHRDSLKLIARVCPDGTKLLAESAVITIPTAVPTLAETTPPTQASQPHATPNMSSPEPREVRPPRESVHPTPIQAASTPAHEVARPSRSYTIHADTMAITGMRLYAGWTFNVIGTIVSITAWVWLLFLAYEKSGWWFLGVLCFASCIVTPIFIVKYWQQTRLPFVLWLSSIIFFIIAGFLVPGIL